MATFRAILEGGPYDGQEFPLARLVDTIMTAPQYDAIDMYRLDPLDSEPTVADVSNPIPYRLMWDPEHGEPARTATGHYRYRDRTQTDTELFGDLPVWLVVAYPHAYRWRNVGLGRWTAREALCRNPESLDVIDWLHLWVAAANAPDGSIVDCAWRETRERCARLYADADAVESRIWRGLEQRIEHALTPECVVPDCTAKGVNRLTADAAGRLAGRHWQPGDEIRLCPPHYLDVARVPHTPYSELPQWLRADVEPEPDIIEDTARWIDWARRAGSLHYPWLATRELPPYPGDKPADSPVQPRTETDRG